MRYHIQASCGCHIGKVRKNNEDNFFFEGKCLERENQGLRNPVTIESNLKHGLTYAIFDGIGGENFGEYASYAAARCMQQAEKCLSDYFIPEQNYLKRMTEQLNKAVVDVQQEMCTNRMGTTLVSLYFSGHYVYVCNVGDSRAYRLRNGEFLQLSTDHVEKRPSKDNRKAPLTQYLGYGTEDVLLDPCIAKSAIHRGDMYLLCSDGLTDMVTNFEIADIMLRSSDTESCVQELIQSALEHGGRDNITIILCKVA